MNFDRVKVRSQIKAFDFKTLFVDSLGWNHHHHKLDILIDGKQHQLSSVAEKQGLVIYLYQATDKKSLPEYPVRRKIETQTAKQVYEHIIIYADNEKTFQIWQWVKRELNKPVACREFKYYCGQTAEILVQKIEHLVFTLQDEENGLTIVDVSARARQAFDVEKITKRFYDLFQDEHGAFYKFIKGIPDEDMHTWYVSVMLNRLMFIYFIQKKGFLNNDVDYLKNKLVESKEKAKDEFYTGLICPLFFEGFAKKETERSAKINALLGKVPYLNGGIFQKHEIELQYGKTIEIPDKAFDKIFGFFDSYQWHLDDRPIKTGNEINPDVLGYIFEKYINQKQMGAYYTKEDITEYISKNTVIPYIFDFAKQKCKVAFEGNQSIWQALKDEPDKYFYPSILKGVNLPLPDHIAFGLDTEKPGLLDRRKRWNEKTAEEYALPTEIWRETVARRQRYKEVRDKIKAGEINDINDFITYNLNIRQLAQDVIQNCEGPDLLKAFWQAIEKVTVLDPTCGSGAFLFAALNILEPLYEACLDRMQVFLDEWGVKGAKDHPNYHKLFEGVIKRIDDHPNRRYFILKSIIINNLYGVDIMEEAVEICKLRLFLKLVAQVEKDDKIEPLPDIDFNIRAGNTLIGFANYQEVKRVITGESQGQGKIDFDDDMAAIDEKAKDVDELFKQFRKQQTEKGGDITAADKKALQDKLKKLDAQLNNYLAKEYGIDIKRKAVFDSWLKKSRPFHWFIEFHQIINNGGFDVLIGNPPYVELGKETIEYNIISKNTYRDLYAYILERALEVASSNSCFGFIVPISFNSTEGFKTVYELYSKTNLYLTCYSDTSNMFTGITKRLTIAIKQNRGNNTFTSNYIRMNGSIEERLALNWYCKYSNVYEWENWIKPKISYSIQVRILNKIFINSRKRIYNYIDKRGNQRIYYTRSIRYFRPFYDFVPYHKYGNGKLKTPSELKNIAVDKNIYYHLLGLLNANIIWHLFTYYTDVRNINPGFIANIPVPNEHENSDYENICIELMKDYKIHKEIRYNQSNNCQESYYYPQRSKQIIDKIDKTLCKLYGFTDEEFDFIINYDIKYRMGQGIEEEE